jgi:hypothetical protein
MRQQDRQHLEAVDRKLLGQKGGEVGGEAQPAEGGLDGDSRLRR